MSDQVEVIPVDIFAIIPHPQNYKKHPAAQLAELKASLIRFGQVRPTVVQRCAGGTQQYMILAGHGVTDAALELLAENPEVHARFKRWWVAIAPGSWTQADARAYMIADNELARKAQSDQYKLAELLEEQKNAGFDLAALGSSEQELHNLLEQLTDEQLQQSQDQNEDDTAGERELSEPMDGVVNGSYGVLVECTNEDEQEAIYSRLTEEGYTCRVLTL